MSPTEPALAVLKNSPLFKDADPQALLLIAERLQRILVVKGDPVFLEHEPSDRVFFLVSGKVEIVSYQTAQRLLTRVKVIEPGEQFSEFSVLTGTNHTTAAFALEDSELYTLDAPLFVEVLKKVPSVSRNLALQLGRVSQKAMHAANAIEYFREAEMRITPEIPKILPFEMVKKYGVIPVSLEHGTLSVALTNPKNREFFAAFSRQNPETHLRVHLINEADFQRLLNTLTQSYREPVAPSDTAASHTLAITEVGELFRRSKLFGDLPPVVTQQVASMLNARTVVPGEALYRAGEPSTELYLIRAGAVELTKAQEQGGSIHIVTLGPGESFAEISLLTDSPHSLQATAREATELAVLDKAAFTRLLALPDFSVPLAKRLAMRLQKQNRSGAARFNPSQLAGITRHATLVPRELMEQHKVIPLAVQGNELTLGLANPEDERVYAAIHRALPGYRITAIPLSAQEFGMCMQALHAVRVDESSPTPAAPTTDDPKALLDQLLVLARETGAFEARIEPIGQQYQARLRVDDVFREPFGRLTQEFGQKLMSRAKMLCKLNPADRQPFKEAVYKTEINRAPFTSAMRFMPVKGGEMLQMLFQHPGGQIGPFSMLIPERQAYSRVRDALRRRSGLFVISGPALAGKTSTMYSLAEHLAHRGRNVISIATDLEMSVPGVTQIEATDSVEAAFAVAQKLRPGALVLGDLKDAVTARVGAEAAARGMLVIATIEAGNSFTALTRLREMGLAHSLLADVLAGVLGQLLVPAICATCKTELALSGKHRARLARFQSPPESLWHGSGCDECGGTGYRGRIPLFEFWRASPAIQSALSKGLSTAEVHHLARAEGFKPFAEFGVRMAVSGLTTFDVLDRFVPAWEFAAPSATPPVAPLKKAS